MAYEYNDFIDAMRFGLTMSDRDTTDDIWKMVDEVVNKAKAFDEIVPFIRGQYLRANQNYGFAKYYGKSNEELKQAEEELLKIQKVAMTVCNVLGITLGEFIILEDK
ncbi:hypothetical protein [Mammaliicoccus sciuri]|uniref:hypothetical protein n=1 Tax=Mammaliicoccus sciuri TaxID=1296 RepID=UPI0034DCC673